MPRSSDRSGSSRPRSIAIPTSAEITDFAADLRAVSATLDVDGDADWDDLLRGFTSAVDWPPAHFWRQLAMRYPDAKVILTVRDRDAWYDSIASTIFPAQRRPLPPPDDPHYAQLVMPRELILHGTFGQVEDKAHVLSVYDAHNAAVRAAIEPARLLEYDVKDGWAPLCAFLGVPVPQAPFPRSNTQQEFIDRLKKPGV